MDICWVQTLHLMYKYIGLIIFSACIQWLNCTQRSSSWTFQSMCIIWISGVVIMDITSIERFSFWFWGTPKNFGIHLGGTSTNEHCAGLLLAMKTLATAHTDRMDETRRGEVLWLLLIHKLPLARPWSLNLWIGNYCSYNCFSRY